ncbi:MAG: hypothetical protein AAFO75_11955, partial [Pseudomonadota bacterium]
PISPFCQRSCQNPSASDLAIIVTVLSAAGLTSALEQQSYGAWAFPTHKERRSTAVARVSSSNRCSW